MLQTSNNNKLGLVNGQTGYIVDIDFERGIVIVEFDDELYEYDSDMLEDLHLGYVLTVHKSQGSEWRYVIQVVSNEHNMNSRPLVYTGITRAREKLIIVGDRQTLLKSPAIIPRQRMSKIV